ncbi:MAG TPA: 50S ribosomal protein L23 [Candidatus Omnitrophica bacterium]|nr:50S ribosomal protein L23 [Candidatus Omnitrophota bacterium]
MEPIKVIRDPIITERTTLKMEEENEYSFRVDPRAKKNEIKRAVEEMFSVEVIRVNTKVRKPKPRRLRVRQAGKTSWWKEAIVTLKEGHSIDILG